MSLTEKEFKIITQILQGLKQQVDDNIIEAKKGSQPVELDQQAFGRVSRVDAIQQQQMVVAA